MIQFILNNQAIQSDTAVGTTLLDFVRYHQHLRGTKIGCREGDCGACTVLVGEIMDGQLKYQSVTSCLMPLQNAAGKHIVTVEGINRSELSPVQQAIVDEGGTQCGFCTIGFVMSLTGFAMNESEANRPNAIAAIDGNICRCTGYKSLERAATRIAQLKLNKSKDDQLEWLIKEGFLPQYFTEIKSRLLSLSEKELNIPHFADAKIVGGGTDLYVQKPEEMAKSTVHPTLLRPELKKIELINGSIYLGGAVTVQDILDSPIMQAAFPDLAAHMKLVSSTPIRNMATIGGNIVNASPIGDMTIFFMALNATLLIKQANGEVRPVSLLHFYKGYKQIDLKEDEHIESISIKKPKAFDYFNFEKVCKRTHLDIASVNSAATLIMDNGIDSRKIVGAQIAVGGVSPIPLYLYNCNLFLAGKELNVETVVAAAKIAQKEIAPISDARGSATYKRLLFRQLYFAHFIKLFPMQFDIQTLTEAYQS